MTLTGKLLKRRFPAAKNGKLFVVLLGLLLCLAGCKALYPPDRCPSPRLVDLSGSSTFPGENGYSFQFPLADEKIYRAEPFHTPFAAYGKTRRAGIILQQYHAAEDYLESPGTPVYAAADGQVTYSGPMDGYGWLVIIDHPRANLYSLYGHLSPSRWSIQEGAAQKGQLIGFLGDPDENGGSPENPLIPHLHFGIRVGQRGDYPSKGSWRWMAGWISACPQERGWLQPSLVITRQEIPPGGFLPVSNSPWEIWGIEILFGISYLIGGFVLFSYGNKKNKSEVLLIYSVLLIFFGWFLWRDGWKVAPLLLAMAVPFLAAGVCRLSGRK